MGRLLLYARRTVEVAVTILLVTFTTFALTSSLPGSEAFGICEGSYACVRQVTRTLGLNQPLIIGYAHWLAHIVTGNLGNAYQPTEPLTTLLNSAYPITVELVLFSQILAVVVAVPLAVRSALRPNKTFDRASTALSFATVSLPSFIIGPLLVIAFTVKLHFFPGPGSAVPPFWSHPLSNLRLMFLPALTIAVSSISVYQRLLRADMIATLEEDFIVMARAKGLSSSRILFRHALRPSTFTVMTVGGLQLGSLIAGTIVAEIVFGLNGLGNQLTIAVEKKDLPTIQVITVIVAVAYIVLNLLIDRLYAVVDPRVRRART